jgi:putative DNA primase/helicase
MFIANTDIEKIRNAMSQYGIICQDSIIFDEQLHRFKPKEDKDTNGWYVFFDNITFIAGKFGCWKRGISEVWCSKPTKDLTPTERRDYNTKLKQAKTKHEEEQKKRHKETRIKANDIWNCSSVITPNLEHPYLTRKKIKPYDIRINSYKNNTNLVIPLCDNNSTIYSLQFIYPSGEKRFLSGGAKQGHYHALGDPNLSDTVYIAEGYATAATIHEVMNQYVVMAFDSGNLLPVAKNIRKKFPNKKIVVAADNDFFKEKNIGVIKAKEAAIAIKAQVVIPSFKNLTSNTTDFNDLKVLESIEEVRKQITTNCVDPTTINIEEYTMKKETQEKKQLKEEEKDMLPEGFLVNNKGVFFVPKDNQGNILPEIFICSRIDVLARTRDVNDCAHGQLLRFKDRDDVTHSWVLPMDALASDGADYRRSLLNMGVIIGSNRKAREKLTEYLTYFLPKDTALCIDRTGWHDGSFIFPDEVIGEEKEEKIIFQNMAHNTEGFKTKGTLKEWQENIAKYCMGNSRLILAVSAAFAAPLLKQLGEESGGFHFNGASSTGKTTALKIAVSVWGDKKRLQTWRSTSNGLESVAARHNDSLLSIDEMSQVDPKEAGEIAYMLANGSGKNRCKKDGSLQNRATWQLLFLSSGEVGLVEHILQAGKKARAGQQVRFLDIPADAGKGYGLFENLHGFSNGSEFARHLDNNIQLYHGLPIRKFLKKLTEKNTKDFIKRTVIDFFSKLEIDADSDGQVKRAANRFALLAGAGELATTLGITGWRESEVTESIKRCFKDWVSNRGGIVSAEEINALKQIRGFFQVSFPSRFINCDGVDGTTNKNIKKAGFYGRKAGELFFHVETEIFVEEICKGLNSRSVAQFCIKSKWLTPDKDGKSSQLQHAPDSKKSRRFYCFNSSVLGDEI